MRSGAIAVVDTSALILLIETPKADEEAWRPQRRAANELAFATLRKLNARFVVPTPVIAELHDSGSGLATLRELVSKKLASLRTEPLDARAADIASLMRQTMLRDREDSDRRGAVTYDALIAAIAHRLGAQWLLTANPKHMLKCLGSVGSSVQVVDTTSAPEQGQLDLLAHQRRSTP